MQNEVVVGHSCPTTKMLGQECPSYETNITTFQQSNKLGRQSDTGNRNHWRATRDSPRSKQSNLNYNRSHRCRSSEESVHKNETSC